MSKNVFLILLFLVLLFGMGLLAFYSPAEVSKAEFERLQLQVTQFRSELDEANAKIERAEEEAQMWQEAAQAATDEAKKWRAKAEGIHAWAIPLAAASEVLIYLILLVLTIGGTVVGARYCFAVARRFETQRPQPNKQITPVPSKQADYKSPEERMRTKYPKIFKEKEGEKHVQ